MTPSERRNILADITILEGRMRYSETQDEYEKLYVARREKAKQLIAGLRLMTAKLARELPKEEPSHGRQ